MIVCIFELNEKWSSVLDQLHEASENHELVTCALKYRCIWEVRCYIAPRIYEMLLVFGVWINKFWTNAKKWRLHCECFSPNWWCDFVLFSAIGRTWSILSRGRKFGVNDVERPTLYISWTWCPSHTDRSQVICFVFRTLYPCKFPDSAVNDDQRSSSCKYGITEIQRGHFAGACFCIAVCTLHRVSLCPCFLSYDVIANADFNS